MDKDENMEIMMKAKYWGCAALTMGLLAGASTNVLAAGSAGDNYVGVGYAFLTYDESGVPEADLGALTGRFGHFFTDNLAVEGRIGFGVADDTVNVLGVDVDVELDNFMGVYGMAHLPVSNSASVYGMLGFTRGELTASAGGASFTETDTGLSFGVGVDFSLNETLSLNAEYARYLDESAYDVNGFAIGASFKF
ncbi:MAG: porin family protein [Gammaproteobacteria bacterium]|nr:porin family protein [Gammaproteobacteria bacterium]